MWNLKTAKINSLNIFIPLLITVSFLISLVVHSYFFSISYSFSFPIISYYFLLFPNLFFMFFFHTVLDHFPYYLNFYLSYSMLYFFPPIFFYPFYLYSLYLSFIPLIVILFLLSFSWTSSLFF